jgi:hypothetical protein
MTLDMEKVLTEKGNQLTLGNFDVHQKKKKEKAFFQSRLFVKEVNSRI